jgi:hypothetical protein
VLLKLLIGLQKADREVARRKPDHFNYRHARYYFLMVIRRRASSIITSSIGFILASSLRH